MGIQLIKSKSDRKRFIKTAPLINPLEWQQDLSFLRAFLENETNFQVVGRSVYLENDSQGLNLMLEVIGPPHKLEKNALKVVDLEACDVFIYKTGHLDLFSLNLDDLLLTSRSILGAMGSKESKLSSVFHIVLTDEKIELHFFSQKDYIQNQL